MVVTTQLWNVRAGSLSSGVVWSCRGCNAALGETASEGGELTWGSN